MSVTWTLNIDLITTDIADARPTKFANVDLTSLIFSNSFLNVGIFYIIIMLMLVVGGIYIAIIAILAFYSVTFAVAVIGGLQFIADFFVLSSVSVQAMKIALN